MKIHFPLLVSLSMALPSLAQEPPTEILRKKGELTKEDVPDKIGKGFRQNHAVKLETGRFYRIELASRDFDTLLRIENPSGKILAENDDAGTGFNSRIIFKAERTGTHRLVVTSAESEKTGGFLLTVSEASRAEFLASQAAKLKDLAGDDRTELIGNLKKHFREKGANLDQGDVALAFRLARAMEGFSPSMAADIFDDFGGLFAKAQGAEVKGFGRKMVGAGRRLRLPGTELAVKGTTLDGKDFDLKSYRGKIVLVDFWATWCGPCRAQFPSLRQLYAANKDKGFEVVGISTDRDRVALERFQEREKLPWICLHEKNAAEGQPLAVEYGVFMIPLCILVDRDGKVLSLNARGEELERLLEKHLK